MIISLRQEKKNREEEESDWRTASVRSQIYTRRYGEETIRHSFFFKTGNNKTAPESINESEEGEKPKNNIEKEREKQSERRI